MAPTCFSDIKNLHYRTQSLPEAVYANYMGHGLPVYQDHVFQVSTTTCQARPQLPSQARKQRSGLRRSQTSVSKSQASVCRSQTSVCDLGPPGAHGRAPLTQGVYETLLPPPNFNTNGLPVSGSAYNLNRPRGRTQSFYAPSHYRAISLSQHKLNHHHQGLSHAGSTHSINHHAAVGHCGSQPFQVISGENGMATDCTWTQVWPSRSPPHRSVPNVSRSFQLPAKSLSEPLYVDCSVEYDLGEQPVIPPDSAPLLSIHPEFVAGARSGAASTCSIVSPLHMVSRSSPLHPSTRSSPGEDFLDSGHKSLPEVSGVGGRRPWGARRSTSGAAPRTLAHRPIDGSPRARSNLNSKMEATRKLSVESRDSGIGLTNSAATLGEARAVSALGCEPITQELEARIGTIAKQAENNDAPCAFAVPAGEELLNNVNKRTTLTDLMSGLLCCSVPVYDRTGYGDECVPHNEMEWQATAVKEDLKEDRTRDWVIQSQYILQQGRDRCRQGHCGQDCTDGFCTNVWNTNVHMAQV